MNKTPKGIRPSKHSAKDTRSLAERRRQRIASNREIYGAGTKILDEAARVLRREYTAEHQFLVMSAEYSAPEADDPPWESVYFWQRGPRIMPAGCRLVLRPKAGGPPRRHWVPQALASRRSSYRRQ